jgi:hypothetical protein
MREHPSNEEVLAGYHDALLQLSSDIRDDLHSLKSELDDQVSAWKKDVLTRAEDQAVIAAAGHNQFRVKLVEHYMRALKVNGQEGIVGRWELSARQFAEYAHEPLILATPKDADGFHGDRIALRPLFDFLIAERKRLKIKKRKPPVIDI